MRAHRPLLSVAALTCAVLASCSEETPQPSARLAGPVAVAISPTTIPDAGGTVVFIANGDEQDLRAFLPFRDPSIFVRGPNAISPLSIFLGFRPQRLSSGEIQGRGYVVATGSADRVALVDADSLSVTPICAASEPAPCFPGAPVDVAIVGERVVVAFAAVAPASAGVAVFAATVGGGGDIGLNIERIIDVAAAPGGVALSPDGSVAYVADTSSPQVLEVALDGGATPARSISAERATRDVFVTPAYTAANGAARPAGEFLLALLEDGRLQTLDPATGAPAASPFDSSQPIAPIQIFSLTNAPGPTPITDVTFVPCTSAVCRTPLQTRSNETRQEPLVAFASLGDGTAVALVPDASAPQVFRIIDLDGAGPSASAPQLVSLEDGTTLTEPRLSVDTSSLTEGVTRDETITVTFLGTIPGFGQRVGTLSDVAGTLTLEDIAPAAFASLSPTDGYRVVVTFRSGACPESIEAPAVIASPSALTLEAPPPAGCLPAAVDYELLAAETNPWVVESSVRGFLGRTSAGQRFEDAAARFYSPPGGANGPAFAFTIEGADPASAAAFTFTTSDGVSPFRVGSELREVFPATFGLASGVAATADRLYVTLVGPNALLETRLASASVIDGRRLFSTAR